MREAWQTVLALYPDSCRPIGAVESLGNAGGYSGSRLWRFRSPRGSLVLRAWPDDGPDRSRLECIHGWVAHARSLPFVPVPIAANDGRTVQEADGRVWDLSPWMTGDADLARPPSAVRIRAAFGALAEFHACFAPWRRTPSPGVAARLEDVERWIGGGFSALRAAMTPIGADPRSDLVRVWLDRATRLAPALRDFLRAEATRLVPVQPCLRDARPDHFLFDGNRLAGLIDFGAMGMDTVAGDLARLLGESLGLDPAARGEALAAYGAIRPLRDEELRLIAAFERANALLGVGRWARWHFLEHRTFGAPDAVDRGLGRCMGRFRDIFGLCE